MDPAVPAPEEGPDDITIADPAIDTFVCASSCWTRECNHCSSKTTCGIKYDLENNALVIRYELNSRLIFYYFIRIRLFAL